MKPTAHKVELKRWKIYSLETGFVERIFFLTLNAIFSGLTSYNNKFIAEMLIKPIGNFSRFAKRFFRYIVKRMTHNPISYCAAA